LLASITDPSRPKRPPMPATTPSPSPSQRFVLFRMLVLRTVRFVQRTTTAAFVARLSQSRRPSVIVTFSSRDSPASSNRTP
jgi:hypothetical protein